VTTSQRPRGERPKTGREKSRGRARIEPKFVEVEVNVHNPDVPFESFLRSLIYWAQEDGVLSESTTKKKDAR